MRRIALPFLLVVGVAFAASGRVVAGGWATVRLDEPVANVTAGVPFAFGFTIRQHDVRPMSVERATVFAQAQDGGASITADATREGGEGHYVAELNLPAAGGWKWGVRAEEPWGEMAFETLTVVARGSAPASAAGAQDGAARGPWTGVLSRGTCANPDDLKPAAAVARFPVENGSETAGTGPQPLSSASGSTLAVPTLRGVSTLPVTLGEMMTTEYAILVEQPEPRDAAVVACGDVGGIPVAGELAIGLVDEGSSGFFGIGLIREVGDRTELSLYLMRARPGQSRQTAEVTMDDAAFSPPVLTVPVGTTVTWRNEGTIAHSVTGGDLAFDDSAVLDPGQQFSQTFDAPGTYRYVCGPHPSMMGTITVE